MAKKQEKQAYDTTKQDAANSNTNYNDTRQSNQGFAESDPYQGYKNLAENGSINPDDRARLLGTAGESINPSGGASSGGGSSSGGGGGNVNDYYSGIGPLDTHTYDDAENAFKSMDMSTAKKFADTGGIDDAAQQRMRGMGGFEEFANTGGYTDQDKSNIRAKALSPIGAFDTARRDDMSTRRATQGGYTPGFDASSRALSRDTARNISDTSLNAELGIKDKVNAGRQWGISGEASSEKDVQALKTQNQLQGSQQVAQIQAAMANGQMNAADGRARIAQVQQQTDLAIASGRTQRDIAEMQLAAANGNAAASRELARVQMDAQNQRFMMELDSNSKLAGLGGMSDLYSRSQDRGLATDTQQSNSNLGFGNLQMNQGNQIGGVWDGIRQGVGMAGGLAGAFSGMGGAGNTGITGGFDPYIGLEQTGGRIPGIS